MCRTPNGRCSCWPREYATSGWRHALAYRVLDQYDRQQGLFAVEIPDAELFEPQPELNAPPEIIIGQVGVTYAIG